MNEHIERPPFARWLFLHVLPAFLIAGLGAFGIMAIAVHLRKPPEAKPPIRALPAVTVAAAKAAPVEIVVESQGTVDARTQTNLVAEVSGRLEYIAESLYAGSFFKKGDLLARIDKSEYEANLAAARARLAEAQLALAQEQAASTQAREDWQSLAQQGEPGELLLRRPQLARAEANVASATAATEIAARDLARAEIRAPYDGRVREKFVDLGQMLNARTSPIANVYATDVAEIRLPISLDDLAYLDLPESYRDAAGPALAAPVAIEAVFGGVAYQWQGQIQRSEGAVDPQTRLLVVVAQIPDPYAQSPHHPQRPPLKLGAFVTARIAGRQLPDAFELPRQALRNDDRIYIIDTDNRLQIRPVTVFKKSPTSIVVTSGLADGELVCLTPLQYAVEGMEVAVDADQNPEATPSLP